jgi:hypothetical protein
MTLSVNTDIAGIKIGTNSTTANPITRNAHTAYCNSVGRCADILNAIQIYTQAIKRGNYNLNYAFHILNSEHVCGTIVNTTD